MRELPVTFAPGIDPIAAVERACTQSGLTVTLRTTLATYPGSVHWHVKNGRESGMIEITWWPRKGRLWLKIAANRDGHWTEAASQQLKARLERHAAEHDR